MKLFGRIMNSLTLSRSATQFSKHTNFFIINKTVWRHTRISIHIMKRHTSLNFSVYTFTFQLFFPLVFILSYCSFYFYSMLFHVTPTDAFVYTRKNWFLRLCNPIIDSSKMKSDQNYTTAITMELPTSTTDATWTRKRN